jgi:flagellar M-ring protein FliF
VVINRKRQLAALGEGAGPEAIDKQLKEVERLIESAAGIDTKRGDRITVAAVEFLQNGQSFDAVAPPGIVEQLLHHVSNVVNALAIVAVAALLIWFGLRPATRALLESNERETKVAEKLQAEPQQPLVEVPAATAAVGGSSQPNLIADLTEKLGRTPLKRLEQLIDYDEDQAANILKQWMRGAERA